MERGGEHQGPPAPPPGGAGARRPGPSAPPPDPATIAAPPHDPARVAAPPPDPRTIAAPPPDPRTIAAPPPGPPTVAAPPPDPATVAAPPPDPAAIAGPPPDPGTVPPPPGGARRLECPRCGEPAEPGQEVCLRCGALVGRAYRRPPSWRLPAALAALGVLLIGAGVGFGVAELTHDETGNKKKPISLTPTQPVTRLPTTATPTTPTGPSGPTGTTGSSGPTGPATGGAPGNATLTSWPAGSSGWTVVLVTATKQKQAEDRAREAAAKSISAGVLRGSDYQGFSANEWVAFMGQYQTKAAAQRARKSYADKGFPGDPQQIKPKRKSAKK